MRREHGDEAEIRLDLRNGKGTEIMMYRRNGRPVRGRRTSRWRDNSSNRKRATTSKGQVPREDSWEQSE